MKEVARRAEYLVKLLQHKSAKFLNRVAGAVNGVFAKVAEAINAVNVQADYQFAIA